MSNMIYEASVYVREVSYRNFKGEDKKTILYFALDPLQLMQVISSYEPKKVKSGNPALKGQDAPITEEQQLKMVRDLAIQAAGSPSEDGETWHPFTDFNESLVGKAFLTKLASSDGDRREFAEKVILAPFRAFVNYATSDPTNTQKDKESFTKMLAQMENVFTLPDPEAESVEDRRARLAAEMAALDNAATAVEKNLESPIPLPPA